VIEIRAVEAVMTSKLYIYDQSSEIDRKQAAGRFKDDDDVLTIGVSLGVKNLMKVFDQLLGSNQTFNRVVIQTHGGPGKIYFGNEFVDSNVWKGSFYGLNYDKLFPKFTRMYFDGCNVAAGGAGTNFLIAAGYVFLGSGGGDAFGWKNIGLGLPGWLPGIGGHTVHFGGSDNFKRIRFFKGGGINWPDSFVH
jgi:hypothetical protein